MFANQQRQQSAMAIAQAEVEMEVMTELFNAYLSTNYIYDIITIRK